MIGIYKITSPNEKIYIGQSVDIEKRFKTYIGLNCKNQRILYNSFLKHGVDNHVFEIIEKCNESELNDLERRYQDFFKCVGKNGLNCRLTKSTDKSGKISETHKKRISESNKGRKHTSEAIGKIILSKQNTSKETRLKMSLSQKGKKQTSVHSFNISKGTKGLKKTRTQDKRSDSKIVLDTQNGIFYTINELSKIHNKKPMYFYQRLLGIHKNKTNLIYV